MVHRPVVYLNAVGEQQSHKILAILPSLRQSSLAFHSLNHSTANEFSMGVLLSVVGSLHQSIRKLLTADTGGLLRISSHTEMSASSCFAQEAAWGSPDQ